MMTSPQAKIDTQTMTRAIALIIGPRFWPMIVATGALSSVRAGMSWAVATSTIRNSMPSPPATRIERTMARGTTWRGLCVSSARLDADSQPTIV